MTHTPRPAAAHSTVRALCIRGRHGSHRAMANLLAAAALAGSSGCGCVRAIQCCAKQTGVHVHDALCDLREGSVMEASTWRQKALADHNDVCTPYEPPPLAAH